MSAEERIYTINLGKALISQSQHRAVRAVNMVREFASKHMGGSEVKIDEDLAHQIWARGVRRPPRKIRVRIWRGDSDEIIVSKYDGDDSVETPGPKAPEPKAPETSGEPGPEAAKVEPETGNAEPPKPETETAEPPEAKAGPAQETGEAAKPAEKPEPETETAEPPKPETGNAEPPETTNADKAEPEAEPSDAEPKTEAKPKDA